MKKRLAVFMICAMAAALLNCPGCRKAAAHYLLTDVTWMLTAIHYSPMNIMNINKPFSIVFKKNGEAELTVDCNRCSYIYEITAGNEIIFSAGKCTEAYCGVDSQDKTFHTALGSTTTFLVTGNQLEIYFDKGSGILLFTAE